MGAIDNKSCGWFHPSHLHICQIMDSRVIGTQHQLHHQCHQCLRGWEDQGIHPMGGILQGTRRPYEDQPTIFEDEDTKDAVTYQSWCWDITVYHHARCSRSHPSPLCHLFIAKLPGVLVRSSGMDNTWMTSSPYWMSTITMSRPWML